VKSGEEKLQPMFLDAAYSNAAANESAVRCLLNHGGVQASLENLYPPRLDRATPFMLFHSSDHGIMSVLGPVDGRPGAHLAPIDIDGRVIYPPEVRDPKPGSAADEGNHYGLFYCFVRVPDWYYDLVETPPLVVGGYNPAEDAVGPARITVGSIFGIPSLAKTVASSTRKVGVGSDSLTVSCSNAYASRNSKAPPYPRTNQVRKLLRRYSQDYGKDLVLLSVIFRPWYHAPTKTMQFLISTKIGSRRYRVDSLDCDAVDMPYSFDCRGIDPDRVLELAVHGLISTYIVSRSSGNPYDIILRRREQPTLTDWGSRGIANLRAASSDRVHLVFVCGGITGECKSLVCQIGDPLMCSLFGDSPPELPRVVWCTLCSKEVTLGFSGDVISPAPSSSVSDALDCALGRWMADPTFLASLNNFSRDINHARSRAYFVSGDHPAIFSVADAPEVGASMLIGLCDVENHPFERTGRDVISHVGYFICAIRLPVIQYSAAPGAISRFGMVDGSPFLSTRPSYTPIRCSAPFPTFDELRNRVAVIPHTAMRFSGGPEPPRPVRKKADSSSKGVRKPKWTKERVMQRPPHGHYPWFPISGPPPLECYGHCCPTSSGYIICKRVV